MCNSLCDTVTVLRADNSEQGFACGNKNSDIHWKTSSDKCCCSCRCRGAGNASTWLSSLRTIKRGRKQGNRTMLLFSLDCLLVFLSLPNWSFVSIDQGLDDKVIVFKYKKKKNYRRNIGHRQVFPSLRLFLYHCRTTQICSMFLGLAFSTHLSLSVSSHSTTSKSCKLLNWFTDHSNTRCAQSV